MALEGKLLKKSYHKQMERKAISIQKIWEMYEDKAIKLFGDLYKIKISTEKEVIWITRVLPNSVSVPLIISFKNCWDIDTSINSRNVIILNIVHELAHFFSYSYNESYINKIFYSLHTRGIDSHYFIQAVEFGIGSELLGEKVVRKYIEYLVLDKNFKYQKSLKLLLKHNISLTKECLEDISGFFNLK